MRAYLATTCIIFALVAVAHVARMIVEPRFATDPFYILLTVMAGALCIWALRLLRPSRRA